MTSISREFPRSPCGTRQILAVLSICLLSVLVLSGLAGCSTPVPTPTNTPTLPTNTPTLAPETPTAQAEGTPEATRVPLIPLDDDPMLGSADAPVTIIEYSEYLCPYCRTFALETLPQLKEEYVDTGKVKFIYRDFPVHGQPAVIMSMVAECAADQGKFWEMQSFIWQRSDEWSQSEDILATVQGYSDELGMDTETYTSCLQEGTIVERIIEDYNIGVQDGVTGTPAFFINGSLARGALPFEEFQRIIEEQLAGSS
ncbi:MAG: DsbA family protein [Anaerolineae bacterium]|nr:DsbA family protein [Anaerolineae bacterium]